MKETIKEQAKILRQKGYSFREISERFKISKSTASVWARNEFLDNIAQTRLKTLGDNGRIKSKEVIRKKQDEILKDISKKCRVLIDKKYGQDEYKLFLALLYWGEGAKTENRLVFINSDPKMIKFYLWLFRRSFDIKEEKIKLLLHLHNYHNQSEMINFWSKVTGIPKNNFSIYNKPNTGINKKPGYKGCLSIRYSDSRIRKEVFLIISRLENLVNIAGFV